MKQRGFVFPALGPTAYLFIALALAAALFMLRMHWIQVGREEIMNANIRAAVKIVHLQGAVTERVVTQYIQVQGKTRTVTETIEKEVVKYAEANRSSCLDPSWRSLHDRSAANTVPSTTGSADGEGGAPAAATALATITQNYAACHRTADKLDALQDWVRQQREAAP